MRKQDVYKRQVRDASVIGYYVNHIPVRLAYVQRLEPRRGRKQRADAAAVGHDLARSHGTDPVRVRRHKGRAAAYEVHRALELFIGQRRVEAHAHHARVLAVREGHAVAAQLVEERRGADGVDRYALVLLREIHAGRHAGGEHVLHLAGEAQLAEPVYIISTGPGGVVGEVDVAPPGLFQGVDEVDGAVDDLVARCV